MTSPTTQTAEVIQADRDEANLYLASVLDTTADNFVRMEDIYAGRRDDDPLVQAFARHRIASRQPASGDVEAVAALVEENWGLGPIVVSRMIRELVKEPLIVDSDLRERLIRRVDHALQVEPKAVVEAAVDAVLTEPALSTMARRDDVLREAFEKVESYIYGLECKALADVRPPEVQAALDALKVQP